MKRITGVLILAALLLILGPAAAQDTGGGSPITFSGAVEAINGTQITVGGLLVDTSRVDAAVTAQLATGVQVEVTGTLSSGVVSAATIVIISVPPPPPTAAATSFTVVFGGAVFDGVNTTFTYTVSGTGTPPDLSHFDVEIPTCSPALVVLAFSPAEAVSLGTDPTTGINGIKWDLPLSVNDSRTYTITLAGSVPTGTVATAVKGGSGFTTTTLPGPACTEAAIDVEKYVSADGATWQTADSAPGPMLRPGANVYFRFVVTNTGTVELSGLTLTDSAFDLGACVLPAALPPAAFFDCVIGPLPASAGQHTNTATHYFGGDTGSDVPVVIIIEGPVEAININIITIYGINIELDSTSPLISVIRVGDFVRVEGGTRDTGDTIIIVAVTVVIVDVDIYVNDDGGAVYRDDGECANPPPPWATAVGWRRKCEPGSSVLPPGQERKDKDRDDDDDDD
jgi:hypothetical protein